MMPLTDPIISITAVYGKTSIRMPPVGWTWNVNRRRLPNGTNAISSRWFYFSISRYIIGFGIIHHSALRIRHNFANQ